MVPAFDADGNLPPGIHACSWNELVARFGGDPYRRPLLQGLKAALLALRIAGAGSAYIDGSFVTAKARPGDFDACWDAAGVNPALLDPVLLQFDNQRAAQKIKYGGELFPANFKATPAGTRFIDFFQIDKDSGSPKGILAIDLGTLP